MYYRLRGYYPCNIDGDNFKCDPWHVGFWWRMADHVWEPKTLAIFSKFLKPEHTCLDIGAWIGPTTLYAAKRCRRVFSFEPDPEAYRHLLFNIRANALTNVIPFNAALSDKDGLVLMASHGTELGDTTTSMINASASKPGVTVPAISWETFRKICPDAKPDFIKMDVEGAEFKLIPAMKDFLLETKPVLLLSTHQLYFPDNERAQLTQSLMDALSFYPEMYNDQMQAIAVKDVLGERRGAPYLFKF
jgi:FkbM family methyltransferase